MNQQQPGEASFKCLFLYFTHVSAIFSSKYLLLISQITLWKSRHEPDASKSKVLSKVTPVAECCVSGTLNEPEFQKANSQHFLKTQPSKHPPTGLIKIKALRNWLLLLKILPVTRTDWLTRKTELTGNHKKIHVLLCSRYLQCKLYSRS